MFQLRAGCRRSCKYSERGGGDKSSWHFNQPEVVVFDDVKPVHVNDLCMQYLLCYSNPLGCYSDPRAKWGVSPVRYTNMYSQILIGIHSAICQITRPLGSSGNWEPPISRTQYPHWPQIDQSSAWTTTNGILKTSRSQFVTPQRPNNHAHWFPAKSMAKTWQKHGDRSQISRSTA